MYNRPLNIFDVFIPELAKIFDEGKPSQIRSVPLNIIKKEDGIVYDFALYGFDKEDIKVETVDSSLSITAKKEDVNEEDVEHEYREFVKIKEAYRKISVPKEYDLSKISAEFKDGILRLTVSLKDKKEPVSILIK